MKFIKRFVFILLIFSVLIVIVSLFFPSSIEVKRSATINTDAEIVFKQINNLKNWSKWSPWGKIDPSIYTTNGTFGDKFIGEGAEFCWKSENDSVGDGCVNIITSKKNQLIETDVNLGQGPTKGIWHFTPQNEQVEVSWEFKMDLGINPFSKFMGLFIKDYIIYDYELGLRLLKEAAENEPKINTVKVNEIEIEKTAYFISIRDTVNQLEMNNIHGKMFNTINDFMLSQNIEAKSAPLVIYHLWTDSIVDIEAGIPINDSIEIKSSKFKLNKLKPGKAIYAIHKGPYERLPETYFGINEWIRKNKIFPTGAPWEVYETDPSTESNPDNWVTKIYFPLN